MHIAVVSIFVAFLGALGGFTNCLVVGEFHPPRRDPKTRVWRPGWIGNVLIGGIAAVLIWGLYGPCASIDITKGNLKEVSITIAQLLSSLGVGFSGGRVLTNVAGKHADKLARENLAKALEMLIK